MDSRRGANWANIGAFFVGLVLLFLGLLTYGLMLWSRWYPDPTKAPAIWEGLMQGALPLYVVGVCLFLASVVQVVLFRALKRGKRTANQHEAYERTIGHLESKVRRLEERDTTWGIQVAARDDQIETANRIRAENLSERDRLQLRVNELYEESETYKWLRVIAVDQAKAIQDCIELDCQVGGHKLMGDNAFIEFVFSLKSCCVYNVAVSDDLTGWVTFGGERLTRTPSWEDNRVKNLAINHVGFLSLHQPLTSAEAARLLSEQGSFSFFSLNAQITGTGLSDSTRLQINCTPSLSQKFVDSNYPKLDIRVEPMELRTYWGYHRRDADGIEIPSPEKQLGTIVNLKVRFKNWRPLRVRQFKLVTSGPVVAAESGEIKTAPYQSANERPMTKGDELYPNLADLKIDLDRDNSQKGWLQFIVRDVLPQRMLNPADFVVRLHIFDESGEEHRQDVTGLTYNP